MKKIIGIFLCCFVMLSGCGGLRKNNSVNSNKVLTGEEADKDIEEITVNNENAQSEEDDILNEFDMDSDIALGSENIWQEEGKVDSLENMSSGFQSYQIKIERNELSVYDKPGYNTGNEIYIITDRRTITIVDETVVRENGNIRNWGQLQTGGWVSLTAAKVIDYENETKSSVPEDNSLESFITSNAETTESDEIATTEKAEEMTETVQDGVLLDKYIYGCGDEHTLEINRFTFHWYDRYEYRVGNRLCTSIDIISFNISYSEPDAGKMARYNMDYDVNVSDSRIAHIRWQIYEGDYYRGDDFVTVMNGKLEKRCSGKAWFPEEQWINQCKWYAELVPSF